MDFVHKHRILAFLLAAALVMTVGMGIGAASAAAATGGTLTFAQETDPRGLDPALIDDGESTEVTQCIFEGLTQYAKDSTEVLPCLAKSWEVSDDGLVYTFTLQEGVKFQDGSPFNAEAVKFNIERQMESLNADAVANMPYATFCFGYVKSVDVVSDLVVKVTLSQPYTPFLANLAMGPGAPMVSPTALNNDPTKDMMDNPVGTGPYKFVEWQKGTSLTLEANPDYWGEKPTLDKIVFQFIENNATRVSALINGDVDAITNVDPASLPMVQAASDSVTLLQQAGMNINYMAFNVSRPPFDNLQLRKAVVEAINVPELVQALYQGTAQPANSIMPLFMPGAAPDVKPYAYDPEASKADLAAGLKATGQSSLNITMIAYTNARGYNTATGSTLAAAIQQYLTKVGINVTINQYDWTTYKTKAAQGEGDIIFYGWGGDNGDPDNFMNLLAVQDRAMNVSGYNNPDYNKLIDEAASMPNGDARNALYQQCEQIVAQDAVWLPISHSTVTAACSNKVHGMSLHPVNTIFFNGVTIDH